MTRISISILDLRPVYARTDFFIYFRVEKRTNGLAASPSTKTRFRQSLYSVKRSIRFLFRQSNIFLLCITENSVNFFHSFSLSPLCLSQETFPSISTLPLLSSSFFFCVFLSAEVVHSKSIVAQHHRKSRFFARYFSSGLTIRGFYESRFWKYP